MSASYIDVTKKNRDFDQELRGPGTGRETARNCVPGDQELRAGRSGIAWTRVRNKDQELRGIW